MRLGVMQPYFLPYLGYWQLIGAVDKFILYDDVAFKKGGWVNRNRIMVNQRPQFLTVALREASQNRRICEISLQDSEYNRAKVAKTIYYAYRRSPYFDQVFPTIDAIVRYRDNALTAYLEFGIRAICALLDIRTEVTSSARSYDNRGLRGEARILDICRQERADVYVNAIGGRDLYDAGTFRAEGVRLLFLRMRPIGDSDQVGAVDPYLSIVDTLMRLGPARVREQLSRFDFLSAEEAHVS